MLKKIMVFLLLALFVGSFAMADTGRAAKIKDYLKLLESKLENAKEEGDLARIKKIKQLITETQEKLERETATEVAPAPKVEPVKKEAVEKKPETLVAGLVYFDYTHGVQNSTTSDFDITRTYLTFKNKIADNAKTNVTFDVVRNSVSATSADMPLTSYIKYAYVEISDVLPAGLQIIPTSLKLKLGMQPTYWIGYVDKILGIRYIAKNLTDNNSQLSSADLGVGGSGKVDLLGLAVEYDGALINGAGYKKAESDAAKTLNLRVNSEVFPGVEVALGGQADYASSGLTNRVLNALASYKGYGLISYAEYYYGKGNSGLTIGATYDLAELALAGYKVIGRYDSYDAGRDGSATTTTIAGVEYGLAKNVLVALDYIGVAAAGTTTGTINLHSQFKF